MSRTNPIGSFQKNSGRVSYGSGKVGNRAYMNRNGTVENYYYDATDQLTGVGYGDGRSASYQYDAVGNRMSVNGNGAQVAYGTANSLNQYPTVGGLNLGYDLNGNLTGYGGSTYSYDAQNRMVSVSSVVQMSYDARNRCVSRTIGGVTTYLYYDGWNLIEERDAAGQLVAKYIHGANVDEILCRITPSLQDPNTPTVLYYAHDALGSVTHLTAANGAIVERYTYDVFGQPTVQAAGTPASTISSYGNRFLFTGREWLAELGLYDYRNRMYSPGLGRFMQTDPIGFGAGDPNIYRYVGNNAANQIDSFGLTNNPGDFGWSGYSFRLTPGMSIPGLKISAYSNQQLHQIMLQTYGRLKKPLESDQRILDTPGPSNAQLFYDPINWAVEHYNSGQNLLQQGFDTQFHFEVHVNLEGTIYPGHAVNYSAQGMFDRHYRNLPGWRMYLWKFYFRKQYGHMFPSKDTKNWYWRGYSDYDKIKDEYETQELGDQCEMK